MKIVRPVTVDCNTGFDELGQFITQWNERDSLCSTFIWDVRKEKCPICGQGWELTTARLQDQTRLGDLNKRAHFTCVNGMTYVNEYRFWSGVFCQSGVNLLGLQMEEIPNGYWPVSYSPMAHYPNTPWYHVRLRHAPEITFEVGSRKRVYSIEAQGLSRELCEAYDKEFYLVTDTKGFMQTVTGQFRAYIHAYTDEQARDYVKRMAAHLPPPTEQHKLEHREGKAF